MRYRPEIDGLRALAVVPVIFFHAGYKTFSGGFVGVDVFFVISGYLITSIIYSEIQEDKFSLAGFYERRARRILPALFVVCIACIPFAWLWMTPSELKDFAQSLVAVNLFASNILFWRESGYFEAAMELKPLLHTWSLALEEQFYIFFPLFLLLFRKLSQRALIALLLVVIITSLSLAEWASGNHPSANFYLLPTRAWELAVGAVVAIGVRRWNRTGWMAEVASGIGLAMVAYAVLTFDKTVPFPGLWALVPVLGTALIIASAGEGTIVGKVLSWRPIVGIGLVSYSAYLWHQPLFAFARLRSITPPTAETYLLLFGITLLLAWITWIFVELPFRNRARINLKHVITAVGSAGAAFFAFGLLGHINNGFPSRGPALQTAEHRLRINYGLNKECGYKEDFYIKSACVSGSKPTLLVWGDSYAMHLVGGIRAANPALRFVQATRSVCGPFLGLSPTNHEYALPWAKKCLSFNNSVFNYIRKNKSIKKVILSSPFDQYTSGSFDYLTAEGFLEWESGIALESLAKTVASLEALGKEVWIVSPPPRDGKDIGRCLADSLLSGFDVKECDFAVDKYQAQQSSVIAFLTALERSGVRVIWLPRYTCSAKTCFASKDGVFLYRDDGHLSHEGAEWIGLHTSAFSFLNADMPLGYLGASVGNIEPEARN